MATTETIKVVDPGNDTGTDHTSLSLFESNNQGNLVTGEDIMVAEVRSSDGSEDTSGVEFTGWTTDNENFVWIRPHADNGGYPINWDRTKYIISKPSGYVFVPNVGCNVLLQGVQIRSNRNQRCVELYSNSSGPHLLFMVDRCLFSVAQSSYVQFWTTYNRDVGDYDITVGRNIGSFNENQEAIVGPYQLVTDPGDTTNCHTMLYNNTCRTARGIGFSSSTPGMAVAYNNIVDNLRGNSGDTMYDADNKSDFNRYWDTSEQNGLGLHGRNSQTFTFEDDNIIRTLDGETGDETQFTDNGSIEEDGSFSFNIDSTNEMVKGDYCFAITSDGTGTYAYGESTFTARDEVYFDGHVYIPTGFNASGDDELPLFEIRDSSGILINVEIHCTAGTPNGWSFTFGGTTPLDSTTNFAFDGWIHIKLRYKKGTGSNAVGEVWVDGNLLMDEDTGTSTSQCDRIRVGLQNAGNVPSSDVIYVDQMFVVSTPSIYDLRIKDTDTGGLNKGWDISSYLFKRYAETDSWDASQHDGSNTWTEDASAAFSGDDGFKLLFDGTNDDNWKQVDIQEKQELFIRCYVFIPTDFGVTDDHIIGIFNLLDDTTSVGETGFRDNNTDGIPEQWSNSGSSRVSTATNFSLNAWHLIEAYWYAGTGSNGIFRVWADGVEVLNQTALTTSANRVDNIQFGNWGTGIPDASDYYYIDDIKVAERWFPSMPPTTYTLNNPDGMFKKANGDWIELAESIDIEGNNRTSDKTATEIAHIYGEYSKNEFTSYYEEGTCAITVDTIAKFGWNKGLKFTYDGTNNVVYGRVDFNTTDEIYARFYTYFPSANTYVTGGTIDFCRIYSGTAEIHMRIDDGNSDGTPERWLIYNSVTGSDNSTTNFTLDAWHLIEIRLKAGSGSNGGYEFWVDGDLVLTQMTFDWSSYSFHSIRIGAVYSGVLASGDYIYIDELKVDTVRINNFDTWDIGYYEYTEAAAEIINIYQMML